MVHAISKTPTKMEGLVEQIKRTSKAPAEEQKEAPPQGYFNTGNIMLNLALTEHWNWGFGWGKVTNIIGDSFVGKTLQVKTAFAELAHDPHYDDYEPVDDDVEHGTGIDITKMFGPKTAERIVAPYYKDDEPVYSDTVEDFIDFIYKRLKAGNPFLYALDTYDALTDKDEQKLVEANIKIRESNRDKDEGKGKKEKDSYGTSKTIEFNKALRLIKGQLQNTKSGLIIVSQVRENIGAGLFEPKFKRNGGRALKHYSWHEIWLARIEGIKRGKEGRQREVGAWVQAKVTKNRTTGKMRTVEFPVYYDYGVDNIEACVDFLVEEGTWKRDSKGVVRVPELNLEGTWPKGSGTAGRLDFVRLIEKYNLERRLYREAEATWRDVEESLNIDRKPKYRGE